MVSPEINTEPSLFPEIAPDRILGDDYDEILDSHSRQLLESLSQLGITLNGGKGFTTYFAQVRVGVVGLLDEARSNDCEAELKDLRCGEIDYWRFHTPNDESTVEEVVGYIESCRTVKIDDKLELALLSTPLITDMRIGDDHLILAKHIKSIGSLAPWVTHAAMVVENVIAGVSDHNYYPEITDDFAYYWNEAFCAYLQGTPEFKPIWTPEDGAILVWQ